MQPVRTVSPSIAAVGIDVGQRQLHVVGLTDDRQLAFSDVLPPDDIAPHLQDMPPNVWIAIDAPDAQYPPCHAGDGSVSRKFASARCGEIALARRGYWVPWVTPPLGAPVAGWMSVGFDVWKAARTVSSNAIEIYPYAAFRILAGGCLLPKRELPPGRDSAQRSWRMPDCTPRQ